MLDLRIPPLQVQEETKEEGADDGDDGDDARGGDCVAAAVVLTARLCPCANPSLADDDL